MIYPLLLVGSNQPESGKDVAHVSHTVNSVFSIVKRPKRGATVDSTIFIQMITRNELSG